MDTARPAAGDASPIVTADTAIYHKWVFLNTVLLMTHPPKEDLDIYYLAKSLYLNDPKLYNEGHIRFPANADTSAQRQFSRYKAAHELFSSLSENKDQGFTRTQQSKTYALEISTKLTKIENILTQYKKQITDEFKIQITPDIEDQVLSVALFYADVPAEEFESKKNDAPSSKMKKYLAASQKLSAKIGNKIDSEIEDQVIIYKESLEAKIKAALPSSAITPAKIITLIQSAYRSYRLHLAAKRRGTESEESAANIQQSYDKARKEIDAVLVMIEDARARRESVEAELKSALPQSEMIPAKITALIQSLHESQLQCRLAEAKLIDNASDLQAQLNKTQEQYDVVIKIISTSLAFKQQETSDITSLLPRCEMLSQTMAAIIQTAYVSEVRSNFANAGLMESSPELTQQFYQAIEQYNKAKNIIVKANDRKKLLETEVKRLLSPCENIPSTFVDLIQSIYQYDIQLRFATAGLIENSPIFKEQYDKTNAEINAALKIIVDANSRALSFSHTRRTKAQSTGVEITEEIGALFNKLQESYRNFLLAEKKLVNLKKASQDFMEAEQDLRHALANQRIEKSISPGFGQSSLTEEQKETLCQHYLSDVQAFMEEKKITPTPEIQRQLHHVSVLYKQSLSKTNKPLAENQKERDLLMLEKAELRKLVKMAYQKQYRWGYLSELLQRKSTTASPLTTSASKQDYSNNSPHVASASPNPTHTPPSAEPEKSISPTSASDESGLESELDLDGIKTPIFEEKTHFNTDHLPNLTRTPTSPVSRPGTPSPPMPEAKRKPFQPHVDNEKNIQVTMEAKKDFAKTPLQRNSAFNKPKTQQKSLPPARLIERRCSIPQ